MGKIKAQLLERLETYGQMYESELTQDDYQIISDLSKELEVMQLNKNDLNIIKNHYQAGEDFDID